MRNAKTILLGILTLGLTAFAAIPQARAGNAPAMFQGCIAFGHYSDTSVILNVDGKNWQPVDYRSTSPNVFMLGATTCVDNGGGIWVLCRQYVGNVATGVPTWVRPTVPMAWN